MRQRYDIANTSSAGLNFSEIRATVALKVLKLIGPPTGRVGRQCGSECNFRSPSPSGRQTYMEVAVTQRPVILCVDGAWAVLEGRKLLLEENGYQVLTATNGKKALEAFVSNAVDLVLLDYHLSEMNGDVAAMRMRAAKPDVPIALLSVDEWLPPDTLDAVDAFIDKSELVVSFLRKVDYLLSLRFLFRPLDSGRRRSA
jgi:CheY-like chemotaxis protein